MEKIKNHVCARCGDMCEGKRYIKYDTCPSCPLYINDTCISGYINAVFCEPCYANCRRVCAYANRRAACAYATSKENEQ